MVYVLYEQSIDRGSPVECYKFQSPAKTYLYTTADHAVTLNNETYQPFVGVRGSLRLDSTNESELNLKIRIDSKTDVIMDHAFKPAPPASLRVSVYRAHLGTNLATDWILIWEGTVSSISVSGFSADMLIPGAFSRAVQSECPNIYYQNSCNHVLYDEKCKVLKTPFVQETTITQVGSEAITVANSSFSQNFLSAGMVYVKRTKEYRGIIENLLGNIGITYPFSDIQVGDEVTLTAGCDHSFEACKTKFKNTKNYGGFPAVPSDNPFVGKVK